MKPGDCWNCNARATVELYDVFTPIPSGDPEESTLKIVKLGAYCAPHLHTERDRLRAQGRRTGVSVIAVDAPQSTCVYFSAPTSTESSG